MTDDGRFLRCYRCDMGASACNCDLSDGEKWPARFTDCEPSPHVRKLEKNRLWVRDTARGLR